MKFFVTQPARNEVNGNAVRALVIRMDYISTHLFQDYGLLTCDAMKFGISQ
jgi:hypothetical protein